MPKMWAKIQTRFTAAHRWPDAPQTGPEWLLSQPHRHEFHVTLWLEQNHDDRDVEYLVAKRKLTHWIRQQFDGLSLGHKSCEMLCKEIGEWAGGMFGRRHMKVEVLEDGENGALWEV